MSRPIDIPRRTSADVKPLREERGLFGGDKPYFGYIQVLKSAQIHWAVSSGVDHYVTVGPRRPLPPLAFIVEKNLQTRTISIDITSLELRRALYRAILNQTPSEVPAELDFDTLLKHYEALKLQCDRLQDRCAHGEAALEIKLLVHDVLLERALYEGIGLEQFRQRAVLSLAQVEEIQKKTLDSGLDEIEDCFVLGLIPDKINGEYMDALNARYCDLAHTGDLAGLYDLCEPVVRSGETVLPYDPEFLLQILAKGHMEIYLYVLNLVEQTAEKVWTFSSTFDCDVTYDPFCVAIRLGQLETVQTFIRDRASFEGYVCDESAPAARCPMMTPLTAAVFWEQPEIVQALLQSSPIMYLSSYQLAFTMAMANGCHDVISAFMEHEQRTAPGTVSQAPSSETSSTAASSMSGEATSTAIRGRASPSMMRQLRPEDLIDPQLLAETKRPVHHDTEQDLDSVPLSPLAEVYRFKTRPFDRQHEPCCHAEPPSHWRQRPAHKERRSAGRNLVLQLDSRCARVRAACRSTLGPDLGGDVAKNFISMESVWESGVESFRKITRNAIPTSVVEVLHCLLVADVLRHQFAPDDDVLRTHFVNDLGRWRTLVDEKDWPLFDQTARDIWAVNDVLALPGPGMGAEELYHFQELIQNLVFLQDSHERSRSREGRLGRRLRHIRSQLQKQECSFGCEETQQRSESSHVKEFQSIADVLGRLTKDTDSADEDDVELGDFLHLEDLQEQWPDARRSQSGGLLPRTPWKDIQPTAVFILASVAFSVVLVMVSAVQDGLRGNRSQVLHQGQTGFSRSCAIVEDFLDIEATGHGRASSRRMSLSSSDAAPEADSQSAWIMAMKRASQRGFRSTPLSQSLATSVGSYNSALRASISSPSASSFLSTDLSSDGGRTSERLRCLSDKCHKTFSNVSNRNKHMREGCAFRERRGYRCRNGPCTKTLTTKWYRNTHEQTRCRFR